MRRIIYIILICLFSAVLGGCACHADNPDQNPSGTDGGLVVTDPTAPDAGNSAPEEATGTADSSAPGAVEDSPDGTGAGPSTQEGTGGEPEDPGASLVDSNDIPGVPASGASGGSGYDAGSIQLLEVP